MHSLVSCSYILCYLHKPQINLLICYLKPYSHEPLKLPITIFYFIFPLHIFAYTSIFLVSLNSTPPCRCLWLHFYFLFMHYFCPVTLVTFPYSFFSPYKLYFISHILFCLFAFLHVFLSPLPRNDPFSLQFPTNRNIKLHTRRQYIELEIKFVTAR